MPQEQKSSYIEQRTDFTKIRLHLEPDSPLCVIPNGHVLKIEDEAGTPIGIVPPGSGAGKDLMRRYATLFQQAPALYACLVETRDYLRKTKGFEAESVIDQIEQTLIKASPHTHAEPTGDPRHS